MAGALIIRYILSHIALLSVTDPLQDFPGGDQGGRTKLETMARYKFYLAFENNDNVDYVTEKYFQALMMGTVPGKTFATEPR